MAMYFNALAKRIDGIRSSGIPFYQKITDLYVLSVNYDPKSISTKHFFRKVNSVFHDRIVWIPVCWTIYKRPKYVSDDVLLVILYDRFDDESFMKKYSKRVLIEMAHTALLENAVNLILDVARAKAFNGISMKTKDWKRYFNYIFEVANRPLLLDNSSIQLIEYKIATSYTYEEYANREGFDPYPDEMEEIR